MRKIAKLISFDMRRFAFYMAYCEIMHTVNKLAAFIGLTMNNSDSLTECCKYF